MNGGRVVLVLAAGLSLAFVPPGCEGGDDPPGDASVDAGVAFDATCEPGRRFCLEGNRSAVCGPDGRSVSATSWCAPGLVCDDETGQCRLSACRPGETRCVDARSHHTCAGDGGAWVGDPVVCDEGRVCADGACRRCAPGVTACRDGDLARCDPDGGGWQVVAACGADERCHVPSAGCVSEACEGGAILCVSATAYRICRGPDEGWSEGVHPCRMGELCVDGSCLPCPDGPSRCASSGELEICDADAGGYASTPCPALTPCGGEPAACRLPEPPFCIPGRHDCVGELSYQLCADDGRSPVDGVQGCPFGTVCNFGACMEDACADRVMLLVDRSSSMADRWEEVLVASWRALNDHRGLRYGLTFFPRSGSDEKAASFPTLPPGHLNGAPVLAAVFAGNPPGGRAPLAEAFEGMLADPEAFFGGGGRHLIVLMGGRPACEGDDPSCAARLGRLVERLRSEHGVTTWAVGFAYQAEPAFLDAMAAAGGSPSEEGISADDEVQLEGTLASILKDADGCSTR